MNATHKNSRIPKTGTGLFDGGFGVGFEEIGGFVELTIQVAALFANAHHLQRQRVENAGFLHTFGQGTTGLQIGNRFERAVGDHAIAARLRAQAHRFARRNARAIQRAQRAAELGRRQSARGFADDGQD